jgi:hypothetical protein
MSFPVNLTLVDEDTGTATEYVQKSSLAVDASAVEPIEPSPDPAPVEDTAEFAELPEPVADSGAVPSGAVANASDAVIPAEPVVETVTEPDPVVSPIVPDEIAPSATPEDTTASETPAIPVPDASPNQETEPVPAEGGDAIPVEGSTDAAPSEPAPEWQAESAAHDDPALEALHDAEAKAFEDEHTEGDVTTL